MNDYEKMLKGMIYDPNVKELKDLRERAHNLCFEYNSLKKEDKRRDEIVKILWPESEGLYLNGPIYFDYGVNTHFGKNVYANFNLTIIDVCEVNIGDDVMFGPNVSIYTPLHPFIASERALYFDKEKNYYTDKEYGKPVTIGSRCWICGNVTILPGVHIGKETIIGAGSVVSKDIPDGVLAFGNPCKVIRKITKEDSIYLKKELFE